MLRFFKCFFKKNLNFFFLETVDSTKVYQKKLENVIISVVIVGLIFGN